MRKPYATPQPRVVEGLYAVCGLVTEFKSCSGDAPVGVYSAQHIQNAYSSLGLSSCEFALARFQLARDGGPPEELVTFLAPWHGTSGRRYIFADELLSMEPLTPSRPCSAVRSPLDALRSFVEESKPILAQSLAEANFRSPWNERCTAVVERWGIDEVRNAGVRLSVHITGECVRRSDQSLTPVRHDEPIYLDLVGDKWQ
jgi:hypothetical protein